jgi:hypothetical protein
MANTVSVRAFELLCLALWLGGWRWVRSTRNPVYAGAYTGSTLLVLFDWMFNSNWFFRVQYDNKFIALWRIHGVLQPVALAMNYAFYFGAPVAFLVQYRHRLDQRFGTAGWLVVFAASCAALPLFEIPMVRWLHLWHYYQRPAFLLGGVPWSNIWYSGLLTTTCYAAVRLAVRWAAWPSRVEAPVPALVGGGPPEAGGPRDAGGLPEAGGPRDAGGLGLGNITDERERWWRSFALALAGIWAAFYLSMMVQLVWYALAQPWAPTPRPF